ncbi:NADH-quinone oxidoreductase subunit C [Conexivisphaera calida]|uniref:NADH-ubiquinone oxidoreductase chain C n=1 Tax=Conexivisphaera calida TaxID=1874277 RepID=A0A4P2VD23_9ARCH|nr:NADH-quinone oxidoreductase subunit C [Conexivisphaera calida]BBE42489.1 NADH-ubiquinone oxidoreductase chain C [Conexivisphaera calida]
MSTSAQGIVERLRSILGLTPEAPVEQLKGYVEVSVDPASLRDAAAKLKAAGFDHVKSVTAVDYPDKKQIKVIYHASSMLDESLSGYVVGLATSVDRDNPTVPSLSGIWVSAEFQEREMYEFFGVNFEGHPDLRPLLLTPDLAAQRPLRKDFKVVEEDDYLKSTYEEYTSTKRWV